MFNVLITLRRDDYHSRDTYSSNDPQLVEHPVERVLQTLPHVPIARQLMKCNLPVQHDVLDEVDAASLSRRVIATAHGQTMQPSASERVLGAHRHLFDLSGRIQIQRIGRGPKSGQ